MRHLRHRESHRIDRIGWLRAAVLGANDGIISTASLLVGIATAHATHTDILIAGVAALIAGAMSMAAGEYISVSSQADTEKAEIEKEKYELAHQLPAEVEELTLIYIKRGLDRPLAAQVANQLMERDALTTHLRDELGITEVFSARPLQAAFFSAVSFSIGSFLSVLVAVFAPSQHLGSVIFVASILLLAFLGAVAAKIGNASILRGMWRVMLWGTAAMLLTAVIGALLGRAL